MLGGSAQNNIEVRNLICLISPKGMQSSLLNQASTHPQLNKQAATECQNP